MEKETVFVLDTNIISAVLRDEEQTMNNFRIALLDDAVILMCPLVFYEIKRGLRKRDAWKQLYFFEQLAAQFIWHDFEKKDWDRAADLWAECQQQGRSIADADLLIAVYTLNRAAILVTDNVKHFGSLGVRIENWRR